MTQAQEIAIHFLETIEEKITPSKIKKQTSIAKKLLLKNGKDEIIKVIDYAVKTKGINIYSLGYFFTSLNKMLKEVNKEEESKLAKQLVKEMKIETKPIIKEVGRSERNTRRSKNNNTKFRESNFVDFFEGQ